MMGPVLHVACLPFPSFQGTQAAIASMLSASKRAGIDTHLLVYGGAAFRNGWPFRVHRTTDLFRPSLRSGPRIGKLALDAQVSWETRRLMKTLKPERIVAHHVEASFALRAAGVRTADFIAHTALETELSSYLPYGPAAALRAIGGAIDRSCLKHAGRVFAVSPALAKRLGRASGRVVSYLPTPWSVPAGRPSSKREARRLLSIPDRPVALYAGNLDHYQGWEDVIEALSLLVRGGSPIGCLIATESDPSQIRAYSIRRGIADRVAIRRLDGERQRQLVHAAADVAVVPRRAPGGLPVKLLDALGRGVPTVATERALSGLGARAACEVVRNDAPDALAAGIRRVLADSDTVRALSLRGRQFIKLHHSDERYVAALHDQPSAAQARAASTRRAGAPSASNSSTSLHR